MSLVGLMIEQTVRSRMEKASEKFIAEVKRKMDIEGMNNTGKLKNSLKYEINEVGNTCQSIIRMYKYGFYHDRGVKAANIPFGGTRRGGSGGTSKYIEGLISYFKSKGYGDKKAKGLAFGTAHKQKKFGAPLRYRGKGSGFLTDTIESFVPQLVKELKEDIAKEVKLVIVNSIRDTVKEIQLDEPITISI